MSVGIPVGPIDPEQFRLSPVPQPAPPARRSLPTHKKGARFLKGPIPMSWLAAAARQGGKALHVGVALWHLAGMKNNGRVLLSGSVLTSFGVSRYSTSRALKSLERAKLVEVERHPGRRAVVTILDAPGDGELASADQVTERS
jgi:hypothetical protein